MPPATRVGDLHVCPMVTGVVPHVGGPILPPGAPTVMIGFMPAATVSGMLTCVGPPDIIIMGSTGVLINYMPAARIGDPTAHGGVITLGYPTVMIGEVGAPSPGAAGAAAVSSGLAATGHDNPINANKSVYSPDAAAGGGSPGGILDAIKSLLFGPSSKPVAGGTPKQNAIVQGINPKNGINNCGYNIDAAQARLTGKDPNATSPDRQDGSWDEIDNRFNTKVQWNKSFKDAYDAVSKGGDGTSAIIGIKRPPGQGSHVILINNDHGTVGILEAQDWGSGEPKEVITDVDAAMKRYDPDGKNNIGYGIIP